MQKFHRRVHNPPPTSTTLYHTFPFHALRTCFTISVLSSHLRLDLPSDLFLQDFPTKTPQATCHVHLTLLHWITPTVSGEVCISRTSPYITQFYKASSHLLPFGSNSRPQHTLLKHPQHFPFNVIGNI